MTSSERLKREIESIEGRILELQDTLFQVESLREIGVRPGLFRALSIRMLKVGLRRQIRELGLRRKMADNCYAETRKYEGWQNPAEREDQSPRVVL